MTHGETGCFSVNSNGFSENNITAEDILSLHTGYFQYCDLIVVESCSSATSSDETLSIIEAFYERGAKCVIGFDYGILADDTKAFENNFWAEFDYTKTINELFENAKNSISQPYDAIIIGDHDNTLF